MWEHRGLSARPRGWERTPLPGTLRRNRPCPCVILASQCVDLLGLPRKQVQTQSPPTVAGPAGVRGGHGKPSDTVPGPTGWHGRKGAGRGPNHSPNQ